MRGERTLKVSSIAGWTLIDQNLPDRIFYNYEKNNVKKYVDLYIEMFKEKNDFWWLSELLFSSDINKNN